MAPLFPAQVQLARPDSKPAFLALLTSAAWAVLTSPVTVRAAAATTAMVPPSTGRERCLLRLLPAERSTGSSVGELVVLAGVVQESRTDDGPGLHGWAGRSGDP